MATAKTAPTTRIERECYANGSRSIVGMDEVGRGSWAGPLTIVAAKLPLDRRVNGVRDSKMLTEARREELFDRIAHWCEDWAVGEASAAECDALGMSAAQRLAARRALGGLAEEPSTVLVDGPWDFIEGGESGAIETVTIVKGDRISLSIAAASILAKVTRDRQLRAADTEFPAFNFASNKGYPCPVHQTALQGYGPTSIHRRSWAFVDNLIWTGCHRVPAVDLRQQSNQERLFPDLVLQ